jgi:hypothetical protein
LGQQYKIVNPATGKEIIVDWPYDHPPTQEDAANFFGAKKKRTFSDVVSEPGAKLNEGVSQLGSNPVAGLANIAQGVGSTAALPLTAADYGLRQLGPVGEATANAVALPFNAIASLVRGGEGAIQKGVDAAGVPESVQNLGMSPEKAKEAAGAMSGVNQMAAQFLAGKAAEPIVPTTPKTLTGEAVQSTPKPAVDPVVSKVTEAIKVAQPLRGQQEALYTRERGKRIGMAETEFGKKGGEAGARVAMSKLGGELPKVQFDPLRDKITQAELDHLFNIVQSSDKIGLWDRPPAIDALNKLFTQDGTMVPNQSQLAILEKVFGSEFVNEIANKRSTWEKVKANAMDVANTPRTIMSSFDMSMPLRQTVVQTFAHPIKTLGAWKEMHRSFVSDAAFKQVSEEIHNRPTAPLYDRFKLDIIDPKELHGPLLKREEAFMSHLAYNIPGIGHIIRASSRAAHTMVNKVRADLFDAGVAEFQRAGLTPENAPAEYRSLANWLNITTGRGSLGQFQRFAPALNATLFSPRLLASRFQFLNPATYAQMAPAARKMAITDAIKFSTTAAAILSTANYAGLAKVKTDPLSSDFLKMRVGQTRVDPLGGFSQIMRFFSQAAMGERTNLSGQTSKVPRSEVVGRFAESKLNPQVGLLWDWMKGRDFQGEPFNVTNEAVQNLTPLYLQDVYDAVHNSNDPVIQGLLTVPGFYGAGVQTYKQKAKAPSGSPR